MCSFLSYKCMFRHINSPPRMVSSLLGFIAQPQGGRHGEVHKKALARFLS